jgi:hypothetical protein
MITVDLNSISTLVDMMKQAIREENVQAVLGDFLDHGTDWCSAFLDGSELTDISQ